MRGAGGETGRIPGEVVAGLITALRPNQRSEHEGALAVPAVLMDGSAPFDTHQDAMERPWFG